jgi:flagellar biosynthesis activator protein FlaF
MSVSRYQKAQEITEDPRTAEHRMLARVTGMLIDSSEARGTALAEACFYNRKLWTIFQTDLASPANALPDEVKARLISLSIWVQKYTGDVLNGAPAEPLINVNRSIMEGLMPSVPAAATAPHAAAAATAPA